MFRFRLNTLLTILFLAIMLSLTIHPVKAATRSFTVKGGEEVTETLSLAAEDHVTIILTVGGLVGDTINFYITCPNGTVKDFGKVATLDYRFICDLGGEYVLHFSNIDSAQDRVVTLNHEVQHYIFGIPQMLFFVMIVAAICVAMAAAFVLMGKRR
jgi:hypothetical protein